MTVSNSVQSFEETKKVPAICPICKSKKDLDLPASIVNQASNIATISLPKGLICEHHFQMFVDKNFHVRGYQKVDLEIEINRNRNKNNPELEKKNDKDLFENLLLEGNYLEYRPKIVQENKKHVLEEQKLADRSKKMSNKDIYEEFWEFIEDDNEEFQEFKNKKHVLEEQKIDERSKKMSNKEIYEEFWEFIEDDNLKFQEFIMKDRRRKKKDNNP
jgi:hypothetical protein